MDQSHIRNFAIIAHIDHGKSTLADRLLELTGTVTSRDMQEQLLDSNPIERERGITIKLAPVRMRFHDYILNLIDTPGHVDFGYEVSRSLAACEGAILVVDATQGVQAQTLANLEQARRHNLTIIPVINKIDMPNARIEETARELEALGFGPLISGPPSLSGLPAEVPLFIGTKEGLSPILISAKTGKNVGEVLQAVVERVPAPTGNPEAPLRALVFSSHYDSHRGVVVFVRVVDGVVGMGAVVGNKNLDPSSVSLAKGAQPAKSVKSHSQSEAGLNFIPLSRPQRPVLRFMFSGAEVAPIDIGYFMPKMQSSQGLVAGEVGYIATGLKDVRFAKVGDTITVSKLDKLVQLDQFVQFNKINVVPLPGYHEPKPMVFLGLFPISADEFTLSREAMEKLRLSDSAFTFRPITSAALGNGFHCGFLGLLHAEIVQERILREFDLTMMATAPSVEYLLTLKSGIEPGKYGLKEEVSELTKEAGKVVKIQSAAEFPDVSVIDQVKEPVMQVKIFSPKQYVGAIMQLAQEKRGEYIDLIYLADQAEFTYLIPLSEMIIDFFDLLKSITSGYASLDYEFFEYQKADIVKVDILFNHEKVDAFSFLTISSEAQRRGREVVERLVEVIPRQQFQVPVQAAIGGAIIARGDIKAFRKDVIAKLYGGDRTRKDKLLKKQKKGKAKMKMIGRVEIPQGAFFEVLKRE